MLDTFKDDLLALDKFVIIVAQSDVLIIYLLEFHECDCCPRIDRLVSRLCYDLLLVLQEFLWDDSDLRLVTIAHF